MTVHDLCRLKGLTRAQTLVLKQIITSQTVTEIAKMLDLSTVTVKRHLTAVYKAFSVKGRYELVPEVHKMLNKHKSPELEELQKTVAYLVKEVERLKLVSNTTFLPRGIDT